jgi:hypothetical protein
MVPIEDDTIPVEEDTAAIEESAIPDREVSQSNTWP